VHVTLPPDAANLDQAYPRAPCDASVEPDRGSTASQRERSCSGWQALLCLRIRLGTDAVIARKSREGAKGRRGVPLPLPCNYFFPCCSGSLPVPWMSV